MSAQGATGSGEIPDDLEVLGEQAWIRLSRASADRNSPFRQLQLATLSPQGWPEIRSVILRECSPSARQIAFHTDKRSAKFGEIRRDGRVSIHLWDAKPQIQLRLWGQAVAESDERGADAAWDRLVEVQRAVYRGALPPGRVTAGATDAAEAMQKPGAGGVDPGRQHFARVAVTVMRFEWLQLRQGGHRRARFDWKGAWQGQWLVP
ncbi:MAG: pyridoxamine 5'-phosphate oxidase family protein [Pseudomonadota bacterium]